MITVKASNNENRVALWQRDPRHPGGEVYIVGDGIEHEVAETSAVRQAISRGELVAVEKKTATKKSADKAD